MASPFFSGRIPQDLFDKIKQYRAETGESATDVLINALSAYVNHPVVRPAADLASPKIEERFKAMDERLAALELSFKRFSLENIVINTDNKKEFQPQDVDINNVDTSDDKLPFTISNKILSTDTVDNNFDNKLDNRNDELESDLETIQQPNDNKFDNTDNKLKETLQPIQTLLPEITATPFENLTASELAAVTGLTQPQIDSHKRKVTTKYQKIGQPLEEKKLLESPEKITTLKPVTVNDYPYDLFYLGQNEKGNNLWSVLPYDNSRYQQLSI